MGITIKAMENADFSLCTKDDIDESKQTRKQKLLNWEWDENFPM